MRPPQLLWLAAGRQPDSHTPQMSKPPSTSARPNAHPVTRPSPRRRSPAQPGAGRQPNAHRQPNFGRTTGIRALRPRLPVPAANTRTGLLPRTKFRPRIQPSRARGATRRRQGPLRAGRRPYEPQFPNFEYRAFFDRGPLFAYNNRNCRARRPSHDAAKPRTSDRS